MTIGTQLDTYLSDFDNRLTNLEQGYTPSASSPIGFGGFSNLRISCPKDSKKFTVKFDEAILKNASGSLLKIAGATFDIDTGLSGLNGLDTGILQAPNKWYYLHVISDGINTSGVMSLSKTPTLPNGYTFWQLAGNGQVVSINPTVLIWQEQIDNVITQQDRGALKAPGVAANVGMVYQSLNIAEYVPPNAKFISGFMGGASGRDMQMAISPTGSDVGRLNAHGVGMGVVPNYDGFGTTSNFSNFALSTPQLLWWKSVDTIARNLLYISSYTI